MGQNRHGSSLTKLIKISTAKKGQFEESHFAHHQFEHQDLQQDSKRKTQKGTGMTNHKILLTGNYWHSDFQSIVSGFDVPITLVPIEKASTIKHPTFDLILIAQSRRGQYSVQDIENLQAAYPAVPMIGLLGSWCEGETRSGTPWPGVTRVYWHQWEGRYQKFVEQLAQSGITDWHAPKTSSIADRIANTKRITTPNDIRRVAISAWTNTSFAMVADAIRHFGWTSCWVERSVWNAETVSSVDAICIEADSWCDNLSNRIKWVTREVPGTPIVLILNYPRNDEFKEIKAAGISEVISKPFELDELQSAILRAAKAHAESKLSHSVA